MHSENRIDAWERSLSHLIRTSSILHNLDEIEMFELEVFPVCLDWTGIWSGLRIMSCGLSFVETGKENGKQNNFNQCLVKHLIEIYNLWEVRLDFKKILNQLFEVKNVIAERNVHCQKKHFPRFFCFLNWFFKKLRSFKLCLAVLLSNFNGKKVPLSHCDSDGNYVWFFLVLLHCWAQVLSACSMLGVARCFPCWVVCFPFYFLKEFSVAWRWE